MGAARGWGGGICSLVTSSKGLIAPTLCLFLHPDSAVSLPVRSGCNFLKKPHLNGFLCGCKQKLPNTHSHTCGILASVCVSVCRRQLQKKYYVWQKSLLQVLLKWWLNAHSSFYDAFFLFLSCNVQMEKEFQICVAATVVAAFVFTADVLRNTCAIMQLIFLRFSFYFPFCFPSLVALLHCLLLPLFVSFCLSFCLSFFLFGSVNRSARGHSTWLSLICAVRLIKQIPWQPATRHRSPKVGNKAAGRWKANWLTHTLLHPAK